MAKRRRPPTYSIDGSAVLARPRYARTLLAVGEELGEDAARVLEALMGFGVAQTGALAACLGEDRRADAERALRALAGRALVAPAAPWRAAPAEADAARETNGGNGGGGGTLFEAELDSAPPRTALVGDAEKKGCDRAMAAALDALRAGPPPPPHKGASVNNARKRPRTDSDDGGCDGRCWRVGAAAARSDLLRRRCVSLVGRKLNPTARKICEALFALGAVRDPGGGRRFGLLDGESRDDFAERARREAEIKAAPASAIADALRSSGEALDRGTLHNYLEALQYDQVVFVTKVGFGANGGGVNGGGGRSRPEDRFLFEARNVLDHVKHETLHAVLVDRYDAESARLHRVLMRHRALEQSDLAEKALLPPKEARERLYRMFDDGLVTFVEVAKAPDRAGANVFLWAVDAPKAYAVALADARRAMAALFSRRTFEYQDCGKGVVEEEFDDPHAIDPTRNQFGNNDKKKLATFKAHADRIDRAILQLDACCEIFEDLDAPQPAP